MLYSTHSKLNNCKNQTLVLLIKSQCANVLFILQFSSCLKPEHCDEQCCQYSALYVCTMYYYYNQCIQQAVFYDALIWISAVIFLPSVSYSSSLTFDSHMAKYISQSPLEKKRNVKAQSVKSICGHLCGQIITPTCTNIGKDFSKSCKWRFY